MFEDINIKAQAYTYRVCFGPPAETWLSLMRGHGNLHLIIDERVRTLHEGYLGTLLESGALLCINAEEKEKSLAALSDHVKTFLTNKIRKHDLLVGIGGGVIQDITGFLASTIHRGLNWKFIPTTLLAQADSCIGSKNGINVGEVKNILGTFYPPREIFIDDYFLSTLETVDLYSGIGEILKANAIAGPVSFDRLSRNVDRMIEDKKFLLGEIHQALRIKKQFIERDEFDIDERRLFNYGHTFGHALEAGTKFTVPHGLAVSMGMDMANYMSKTLGLLSEQDYLNIHPVLRRVYSNISYTDLNFDTFLTAFAKDKKASGVDRVQIIIPDKTRNLIKMEIDLDERFREICTRFFDTQTDILRLN